MSSKAFLSGLLVTSALFAISSANAGHFDQWGNIEINHDDLLRASNGKNPTLTLEDGTKFSIKNIDASGRWDHYMTKKQQNENVLILKTQDGYEFVYGEIYELPSPTETVTLIPRAHGQYIDKDIDGRPLQYRSEPPLGFVPELDAYGVEPTIPTAYYLSNIARLRLEPFVEPVEDLENEAIVRSQAQEDLNLPQTISLTLDTVKMALQSDNKILTLEDGTEFQIENYDGSGFIPYDVPEVLYAQKISKNEYTIAYNMGSYDEFGNLISSLALPLAKLTHVSKAISVEPSPSSLVVKSLPLEKDSIEEKPALFKVHQEAVLKNIAPEKKFYMEYDPEKNLYVAIEYLTPKGTAWWKTRLGNEAHMQFSKKIQAEKEREDSIPLEVKERNILSSMAHAKAFANVFGGAPQVPTDLLPGHVSDDEKISNLRHTLSVINDDEFEKLVGEKSPLESPLHEGYLSAWRGFAHNLEHTQQIPTWVAYVSSEPVDGPLYKNKKFSMTSPTIKMAMTVTVSESFYNPLGIYASPIANASDNGQGPKGLSMMLHGATARLMGEVQPDYKYMLVRPIASMSSIFKKSGISLTESSGRRIQEKIEKPYIRCTTDFSGRWYDTPDALTDDEKAKFGKSPYTLVDPRTEDYYQIASHWFSSHPFLGGMPRENFDSFPFVTVAREDLEKVRK